MGNLKKKHQITSIYTKDLLSSAVMIKKIDRIFYQHLKGQVGNLEKRKPKLLLHIYSIDLMLCVNFPLAFMIKKIDGTFLPASSRSDGQPKKKITK